MNRSNPMPDSTYNDLRSPYRNKQFEALIHKSDSHRTGLLSQLIGKLESMELHRQSISATDLLSWIYATSYRQGKGTCLDQIVSNQWTFEDAKATGDLPDATKATAELLHPDDDRRQNRD